MGNYTLSYDYPNKPNLPTTPLDSTIEVGDFLVYDKAYQFYNELHFFEVILVAPNCIQFRLISGTKRNLYWDKNRLRNRSLNIHVESVLKKDYLPSLLSLSPVRSDGRAEIEP